MLFSLNTQALYELNNILKLNFFGSRILKEVRIPLMRMVV